MHRNTGERFLRDRFDDRLRGIPAGALHGLLLRLSAIEAFRGRWESAPKPGSLALRRVRESVATRSAAASCRIAGETRPGAASGYADALRSVFDGHASMPPKEDRLFALHAALFRHLPGERTRRGQVQDGRASRAGRSGFPVGAGRPSLPRPPPDPRADGDPLGVAPLEAGGSESSTRCSSSRGTSWNSSPSGPSPTVTAG